MLISSNALKHGVAAIALIAGLGLAAPAQATQRETAPAADSSIQMRVEKDQQGQIRFEPAKGPEAQPGQPYTGPENAGRWGEGHGDKSKLSPAERLDARIQHLHEKLQITPAQETQWGEVAKTMRDNEAAMHARMEDRRKNADSRNAIEDLQTYEGITTAHAEGIRRMIAAFQPLYAGMSDEQKKNADNVFGKFEGHRFGPHKKGAMHHKRGMHKDGSSKPK